MRTLKRIPRRDPAPSRVRYRMQRLWLTPLYRALMRVGVPVFLVILLGGWFATDEGNREAMTLAMGDLRRTFEERPEFMVKLMAVEGATPGLAEQVRDLVPVEFPISSFEMDIAALQKSIAALDAVASVDVIVRKGGVLAVEIKERMPVVVWRGLDAITLMDATGHPVAPLQARLERPDLPLISGEGAERVVPEAMRLFALAKPIETRVRGLVRVGERRWDMILEPAIRLQLPEQDPGAALEQIIALHQAQICWIATSPP